MGPLKISSAQIWILTECHKEGTEDASSLPREYIWKRKKGYPKN